MPIPVTRRAALPVALLLAGCLREAPPDSALRDTTRAPSIGALVNTSSTDSLRLELELPRRVAAGGSVPITLRARNAGSQPIQLYLRGRIIAFDLIVSDSTGALVWQRLHDQAIPAIVQARLLGPGDTLTFRDTWDLRTDRNRPVAPGRYTVVGTLLRDEVEPFRSESVALEVGPAP